MVAESVDALVLGTSAFGREGSSPSHPTSIKITGDMKEIKDFIQELYDSAISGHTGMLETVITSMMV